MKTKLLINALNKTGLSIGLWRTPILWLNHQQLLFSTFLSLFHTSPFSEKSKYNFFVTILECNLFYIVSLTQTSF